MRKNRGFLLYVHHLLLLHSLAFCFLNVPQKSTCNQRTSRSRRKTRNNHYGGDNHSSMNHGSTTLVPLTNNVPTSDMSSLELNQAEYSQFVRALASKQHLRSLRLTCTMITQAYVTKIATLHKLASLDLSSCTIQCEISGLRTCTSLTELSLNGCDRRCSESSSDVSVRLADFRDWKSNTLTSLDLSQLEPSLGHHEDDSLQYVCKAFPRLCTLVLEFNRELSELGPVASLTQLRNLNLGGTSVTSLHPLRALKELRSLSLAYIPNCFSEEDDDTPSAVVPDLAPLAELKELQELDIRKSSLTDAQLRVLEQQHNGQTSYNIKYCTQLSLQRVDQFRQKVAPCEVLYALEPPSTEWISKEVHRRIAGCAVACLGVLTGVAMAT